jgi:uncharacterized protein YutE (UPF0331/DUF86 family)
MIDAEVLAERTTAIERHLKRVADCLPARPEDLRPLTDASDAVVLHLWLAVQIAVDLAVHACVRLGLGSPPTYADAFRRLENAGILDSRLATALVRAAGFRNVVAHAYEGVDLLRVHAAASTGPADLRAFLTKIAARAPR